MVPGRAAVGHRTTTLARSRGKRETRTAPKKAGSQSGMVDGEVAKACTSESGHAPSRSASRLVRA